MNLTAMRYKNYTWPYNPETYEIAWKRTVAIHKVPFGRYALQDLGRTCRVMRGEGTFCGSTAYQEFRKLAEVFAQDGPGMLVHPVWQASSAYFVSLELTEKPLPEYVRYSFEFWEDGVSGSGLTAVSANSTGEVTLTTAQSSAVYYTVKKGDTLWAIANKYGVTLSALIAANPQIKNPNLIYAGNQVKIP